MIVTAPHPTGPTVRLRVEALESRSPASSLIDLAALGLMAGDPVGPSSAPPALAPRVAFPAGGFAATETRPPAPDAAKMSDAQPAVPPRSVGSGGRGHLDLDPEPIPFFTRPAWPPATVSFAPPAADGEAPAPSARAVTWTGAETEAWTGPDAPKTLDVQMSPAGPVEPVPGGKVRSSAIVKQVDFKNGAGGAIRVQEDPGRTAYPGGPEYMDANTDGIIDPDSADEWALPVAYVRGTTPTVSARFKVFWTNVGITPGPTTLTGLTVSATSSLFEIPETTATLDGDEVVLADAVVDRPLPNEVWHDTLGINWYVHFKYEEWVIGGEIISISTSANQLYATLAQPVAGSPVYHTVVHTSTAASQGATNPSTVVNRTYEQFTYRSLHAVQPAYAPTGTPSDVRYNKSAQPLHYYKEWNILAASTSELLEQGDSRCGGWGLFMADTLKVHGIPAKALPVVPKPDPTKGLFEAFVIQRWDFQGAGSSKNADYPYGNLRPADDNYMLKVDGVWQYKYDATDVPHATGKAPDPSTGRGQGNTIPKAIFIDHALVRIGDENKLYDPSYGTGPFVGADFDAALNKWEDASVAGFHAPQLKDSNRIPGKWEHFFRKNVVGVLESKQE